MQLLRGDAHLCAEAQLSPIGEPGGDVDSHRCGIDGGDEGVRVVEVLRHDHLGVAGAVGADMVDGLFDPGDELDGDLESQVFLGPVAPGHSSDLHPSRCQR